MQALVNEPTATYSQSNTSTFEVEFPTWGWLPSSIYFSEPISFPDNIAEMFRKLDRIVRLPANWDSYSASPPSPAAVAKARSFLMDNHMLDLPFYFLAPGVNGEIMIEFQKGNRAAELYFMPNGENELILFKDDEVEREGDLNEDFREFIDFFTT